MIKQGAIAWLNLEPQTGTEPSKRRPVVVVSNGDYHALVKGRMAMVCPISTRDKGFAMNVALDETTVTQGVVLTADAKVLDMQARNYDYIEDMPVGILLEVLDLVGSISRYQGAEN